MKNSLEYIDNGTIFYGDFFCNGNKIEEVIFNLVGKTIIETGIVVDCHKNEIFYILFDDNTGVMYSPASDDYGEYHVEITTFKYGE